jgi:hypothetical protein
VVVQHKQQVLVLETLRLYPHHKEVMAAAVTALHQAAEEAHLLWEEPLLIPQPLVQAVLELLRLLQVHQ